MDSSVWTRPPRDCRQPVWPVPVRGLGFSVERTRVELNGAGLWVRLTVCSSCCSGFGVGIYTTNSPEACQYVAENCKANIIVVENHKQLQKILQVSARRHDSGFSYLPRQDEIKQALD